MRKLRVLWIRLRGIFRTQSGAAEIDAELESHLQMHTDDNLRAGMAPDEARRRALIQLGGVEQTRQAYRERATLPKLEDVLQDARYALRTMARNPGFAAVAILTLAVGIGASTTAFSWIDTVLLRPLGGVSDPQRLVALESVTPGAEWVPNSYPDYQDFRDHLRMLQGVAVTRPAPFSVGAEDHAERVAGELVSGNFFAVLGVQPELGRMFAPDEYGDKPGAFPVAVISDRYWRSHYAADPGIVGKTIRVNQHELTVVGVAPAAFHGSIPAVAFDLWVPYMQQPVLNGVGEWMLRNRQNRNMLGIARLSPGVTMEQARQELAALAGRMAVANADVSQGMSATLLPLSKSPHGPQGLLAGPLRILMGVCLLLLGIVCVNVANLLLARATVREKEFSTRLALGANRRRLVQQVLTESLMITGAGTILGVAATPWLSHLLQALMPPGQLSLTLGTGLHVHVLLFTAGLCVLATLAAGVVPAMVSGRADLNTRAERRRTQRRGWTRTSSAALGAGRLGSRAGARGPGLGRAPGPQLPADQPHRSGIRSESCSAEPVLSGHQRLQSRAEEGILPAARRGDGVDSGSHERGILRRRAAGVRAQLVGGPAYRRLHSVGRRKHEDLSQRDLAGLSRPDADSARRGTRLHRARRRERQIASWS